MIEPKEPIDLNDITGYNQAQEKKVKKNPNELDNEAFMKLFLEQLKNQDPTSPMETDKIITQTAQLTQVEMQEQTKQTMLEVAKAMESTKNTNEELKNLQSDMKGTLDALLSGIEKNTESMSMQDSRQPLYESINILGKMVETKMDTINLEANQQTQFQLYFDEPIDANRGTPKVIILDSNDDIIREIDISPYHNKSGYLEFIWDGKDNMGNEAPAGEYKIIASYNENADGSINTTKIGRGKIDSVVIDNGKAQLRLGNLLVSLDDTIEVY